MNKKNEQKIVELEQKIGELTAGWQRCQADFMNFRRQTEEDKKRIVKCANTDLITEILPVLDNFQLAAKHVPNEIENNNWVIGIKQIERQLEMILENSGLKRIVSLGQPFDPNFHEAIEHVTSGKPENEIVEEVLSGYTFDGVIVRPAKVKVSK